MFVATANTLLTEKGNISPGTKKTITVLTRNINIHIMGTMLHHCHLQTDGVQPGNQVLDQGGLAGSAAPADTKNRVTVEQGQ